MIVANGDWVACRGLAHDIGILINQDHVGHEDFIVDCYSIPLDCYDMVLRVNFLRILGSILWDFDDLCLAFWHHGRHVLSKGTGSMCSDIPPTGRLHVVRSVEPALLDYLLQSFEDIFMALVGLLPTYPCDHRIHLKPNTEPVAIRPYRYP